MDPVQNVAAAIGNVKNIFVMSQSKIGELMQDTIQCLRYIDFMDRDRSANKLKRVNEKKKGQPLISDLTTE